MTSQKYFFMKCYGRHPIAPIGNEPELPGVPWTRGEPVEIAVKEPLVYILDMDDLIDSDPEVLEGKDLSGYGPDDYNIRPLMTSPDQPLMRNDLLAVLNEAGVDNLEIFQAKLKNPVSGTEHDDFSAFNIVGVADFEWARDLRRQLNQREFRVNTPPFLMFRLFEYGPIVVHDTLRQIVEESNIEGVEFIPTYENY